MQKSASAGEEGGLSGGQEVQKGKVKIEGVKEHTREEDATCHDNDGQLDTQTDTNKSEKEEGF